MITLLLHTAIFMSEYTVDLGNQTASMGRAASNRPCGEESDDDGLDSGSVPTPTRWLLVCLPQEFIPDGVRGTQRRLGVNK
jgi:hypothetical protein